MSTRSCLWPLICPVCQHSLTELPGILHCAQGHSFDIAREGYVNLLLGSRRVPSMLGDAKPMVRARRRFLEAGHYEALSDRVNALLLAELIRVQDRTPVTVLDVGCGEGYYTGRLGEYLSQRRPDLDFCFFATDIAKEAARLGSKRYGKRARFVVANIRQRLPFATHSIGIILNLFAPRNVTECSRLSNRAGILLVVIPADDHLRELRNRANLLTIEAEKRQKIMSQFANRFKLQSIQPFSFSMKVVPGQLEDLVQMTPNYWHMNQVEQQRVAKNGPQLIRASFELLLFENISS